MSRPTDTTEKGLQTLIVESLIEDAGYHQGANEDYDRHHTVASFKKWLSDAIFGVTYREPR